MTEKKEPGRPKTDPAVLKKQREERREKRSARRMARKDVPDVAKIRLAVPENPRNVNSIPWKHFQLYEDGMTVGDLLGLPEGSWLHLQADIESGYITIEK